MSDELDNQMVQLLDSDQAILLAEVFKQMCQNDFIIFLVFLLISTKYLLLFGVKTLLKCIKNMFWASLFYEIQYDSSK